MKLVFVRHAMQFKTGAEEGHITPAGAQAIQRISEKLRVDHDIHPNLIVTSPAPRGVESAAVAAKVFQGDLTHPEPVVVAELNEEFIEGEFLKSLRDMPDAATLLCVSHEAAIAANVGRMVSDDEKKFETMMWGLDHKISNADAVILEVAAQHWSEVREDSVPTFEIVHAYN